METSKEFDLNQEQIKNLHRHQLIFKMALRAENLNVTINSLMSSRDLLNKHSRQYPKFI